MGMTMAERQGDRLVGRIFGKWTVKTRLPKRDTSPHSYWLCVCECGRERELPATNLTRGKSLGCKNCSNLGRSAKHPINVAFSHVKGNASKRRIEFSVTKEEAYEQLKRQGFLCALTGTHLHLDRVDKQKYYSGCNLSLDRIDSNRGYVVDNIQWVYKPINNMKWKLDEPEFIRLCGLVIEYSTRRKSGT